MEVHVIAPGGDRQRRIRDAGFAYHELSMDRAGTNPATELKVVAELSALYRRIRPDIAHHIALKSAMYGAFAARSAGVPAIVGSLTGLGYTFIPGGFKRVLLRETVALGLRAALRASRVHTIFQNPDDRAFFVKRGLVNPRRTSVILGSGVDVGHFRPREPPTGIPRICFGSRMLRDKGIAELVEALRILRARGVAYEAWFAGVPDPANPATISEQELRGWQSEGLLEWRGQVDDMAGLLADSHIACLPSYREGLPLFLAEAAACGRAAVTTDVPGCRSVVRHEQTGLLVPAQNGPAIADALQRLLEDRELRERLGRAARSFAEAELSAAHVVGSTFDVYRALLPAR
jgi:glycosyltransferase involved in cell wall biosynthesis